MLGNGGHRIMKKGEWYVKVGKFVLENEEIVSQSVGMLLENGEI